MADRSAPHEDFADIVHALASTDGVSVGSGRRGFGSDALQADGRIFAMARRGGLVLKLPSERVAELVASGDGEPFDTGKGRPMKEWVVVSPQAGTRWLELAREALAFVTRRTPGEVSAP
jgi:TfoX/Sxy family transcriptional regulator of competence genes